MSLIDRASTFRGRIVDHGVSKSSGGYPQWVASLIALEIYDAEEQVWVDWSEYDVNEITTYQVLFGAKEETLAVQQLKKIAGWDGASFAGLNGLDLSETKIQFRVEPNTYEGKTRLQVSWIDEYDAVPGRTVRKLDAKDLQALDAQYKQFLGKAVTPAKAPGKVTKKNVKATQPRGPVKKKSNDPLGPPATTTPAAPATTPPAPPDPNLPVGKCTKAEAWQAAYDMKAKDVSDQRIAEVWTGACHKVAPKVEQEDITEEQWFLVKEIVLKETGVF